MWESLNSIEILEKWGKAAEVFANGRTPNYGRYAQATMEAWHHYTLRRRRPPSEETVVLFREAGVLTAELRAQLKMAEQMLRAKPHDGRDALDSGLLRSTAFAYRVTRAESALLVCSQEEGLFDDPQRRERWNKIGDSVVKRRRQLGMPLSWG